MGPKSIENHVLKIFGRDLSEIGATWTPEVSLGTKILVSKFWSNGTPLGSMGPLSLKDPDQRFPKHDFLLIWDPFDFPKLAALSAMAEKLKAIAAWCEVF